MYSIKKYYSKKIGNFAGKYLWQISQALLIILIILFQCIQIKVNINLELIKVFLKIFFWKKKIESSSKKKSNAETETALHTKI